MYIWLITVLPPNPQVIGLRGSGSRARAFLGIMCCGLQQHKVSPSMEQVHADPRTDDPFKFVDQKGWFNATKYGKLCKIKEETSFSRRIKCKGRTWDVTFSHLPQQPLLICVEFNQLTLHGILTILAF
jgi:hypothetical protein